MKSEDMSSRGRDHAPRSVDPESGAGAGPRVQRTTSGSSWSSERSSSTLHVHGHGQGSDEQAGPSAQGAGAGQGRRKYGPACDACRLRKVKCDASYAENNTAFKDGRRKCVPCTTTGIPCTFQHKARRRGPVPQYMRRLHEEQGDAEDGLGRPSSSGSAGAGGGAGPSLSSQLLVQPHTHASFVTPDFATHNSAVGLGTGQFSHPALHSHVAHHQPQPQHQPQPELHQHQQHHSHHRATHHMSLSPQVSTAALGDARGGGPGPRRSSHSHSHSHSHTSQSNAQFIGLSPHEAFHPYAPGPSLVQRRSESRDSRSIGLGHGGGTMDVPLAEMGPPDSLSGTGLPMSSHGHGAHTMQETPSEPHWTPSGYINTGVYEEPTPASVRDAGPAMDVSTGQTNPISLDNESTLSLPAVSLGYAGQPAVPQPLAAPYNPYYAPELRFFDLPAHASSPVNPLEAVLPRRQMYEILDTFFEYVYPLLALPHRPSLLADVARRREEGPGVDAEEFTALVLGVVAFTLVQLPHDMIPSLDKVRMRDLVLRCCNVLRPFVAQEHDRPSLDRMVATWCYGTVLNNRGRHMQARALHAGNVVNGLQTGLNDPLTYVRMDPLAQQMHRRMWWNLYMADRSSTFSENGHLLISEDECRDVELPLEVDDEYITPEGVLPVPPGRPSVVRGFVGLLRLFRLGGLLLHGRRRDRWERPAGIHLKGRLSELDDLLVRIEDFMLDCAPEMRLEVRAPPSASSAPGLSTAAAPASASGYPGQTQTALDTLAGAWDTISPRTLRTRTSTRSAAAFPNAPFLVQQGNMYVSQQMLRLMVITYRDELRALAHQEAGGLGVGGTATVALPRPDSTDATDQVMSDLLGVLHSLPTEIHVINSFPGVSKIRFVASTLLTKLENDALLLLDQQSPHEDVAQAKAKEQLLEYLRFLTTIEQMYTLRDET